MRRMSVLAVIVFLGAAVLGSSSVEAQGKGLTRNILQTFRAPSAQEQQNIATQLELTAEQKTQMSEVNNRLRNDTQKLRQDYQNNYKNVVSLMNQQQPDKGRVNEALKNFHQIHSQVLNAEVRYWMDLKTILSPAQNKKLWNMFEQTRVR